MDDRQAEPVPPGVWKRRNARALVSGLMPGPSSVTVTCTRWSARRAESRTWPPSGAAESQSGERRAELVGDVGEHGPVVVDDEPAIRAAMTLKRSASRCISAGCLGGSARRVLV